VFPVVVNVAINEVTVVPNGTVAVIFVPDIVPVTSEAKLGLLAFVKLKAVISQFVPGSTETVTVYVCVDASAAVTKYDTGLEKLFAEVPLVCTTPPTFTDAPVVVNVAIKDAGIEVPYGRTTEIAVPLIVPVTSEIAELLACVKLKAVIALALDGAAGADELEESSLFFVPGAWHPISNPESRQIINIKKNIFFNMFSP
jgi:hypothetical protein